MNCFFSYTIKYYDELDRADKVATSIVCVDFTVDSIKNLADCYVDEQIIRILDSRYLNDTVVLECKDAEFSFPAHFECDPSVE